MGWTMEHWLFILTFSHSEKREPQNQTMSSDQASSTASGLGVRGGGAGERDSDISQKARGADHVEADDGVGDPGEGSVASAVKVR